MEIRDKNFSLDVLFHVVNCPSGEWARDWDLEENVWFAGVCQALPSFLRVINTNLGRGIKWFPSQQKSRHNCLSTLLMVICWLLFNFPWKRVWVSIEVHGFAELLRKLINYGSSWGKGTCKIAITKCKITNKYKIIG